MVAILLTSRQETILSWLIGITLLVVFVGGALFVGSYVVVFVGIFLLGAYRRPLQTVVAYLIAFGVLSALVWFLEGGRDKYGWASMIAIVVGIAIGGLYGLDASSSS